MPINTNLANDTNLITEEEYNIANDEFNSDNIKIDNAGYKAKISNDYVTKMRNNKRARALITNNTQELSINKPKQAIRKGSIQELDKAIRIVQRQEGKSLLIHAVQEAYNDNTVLIALLRKLIPDLGTNENAVAVNILNYIPDTRVKPIEIDNACSNASNSEHTPTGGSGIGAIKPMGVEQVAPPTSSTDNKEDTK